MGGEIERELIAEREKYKVCRTEKREGFFTVEKEIKGLSFKWCWKEVKERGKK
jgi:hypothetical protein